MADWKARGAPVKQRRRGASTTHGGGRVIAELDAGPCGLESSGESGKEQCGGELARLCEWGEHSSYQLSAHAAILGLRTPTWAFVLHLHLATGRGAVGRGGGKEKEVRGRRKGGGRGRKARDRLGLASAFNKLRVGEPQTIARHINTARHAAPPGTHVTARDPLCCALSDVRTGAALLQAAADEPATLPRLVLRVQSSDMVRRHGHRGRLHRTAARRKSKGWRRLRLQGRRGKRKVVRKAI